MTTEPKQILENWQNLLRMSREHFIHQFGDEMYKMGADWVYSDLEELFTDAEPVNEANRQADNFLNYSIDLQRIIESICNGREIVKPKTGALFHYNMAVKYQRALQSTEPVNRQDTVAIPRELFELLKGLYLNGRVQDYVQDYDDYHRTEYLLKPYAEQQLASGLNLDDGLNGTKNSTVFIPRDVLYRIVNTAAKYLSVTAIQLALKPYVKGGE